MPSVAVVIDGADHGIPMKLSDFLALCTKGEVRQPAFLCSLPTRFDTALFYLFARLGGSTTGLGRLL